ncbi:hypothetical protein Fmac_017436 [Flemingia macrophylla]|uniref:Uncharacterized protein n=1 Tax=Flemingia macrophylla TaxID=520843 RepID=A0ABD1M3Z1_9FABA
MRQGANKRVSISSMKSLNLPPMHISLQKLCGPVCAAVVVRFKRYHNIILVPHLPLPFPSPKYLSHT